MDVLIHKHKILKMLVVRKLGKFFCSNLVLSIKSGTERAGYKQIGEYGKYRNKPNLFVSVLFLEVTVCNDRK